MEELLKKSLSGVGLSTEQRERILKNCTVTPKRKRYPYALAVCACLAVLVSALALGLPRIEADLAFDNQAEFAPEDSKQNEAGYSNQESYRVNGTAADVIRVNDMTGSPETDSARLNWENGVEEHWSGEQVQEYFGRKLLPEAYPADLTPDPLRKEGTTVVRDGETGELVYDVYWMDYWNGWLADGAWIQECDGGRGFRLLASRVGLFSDGIFLPEEDMELSTILGTEVLIGYRRRGTLYDENHRPTFEWDAYQAQFTMDGVQFEITTDAMTLEELVGIIRSILS